MANIAQIVNVLQAMILTEGDKMLLTPTYHVFEMYKVHQDATRLPLELKSPEYSHGKDTIPAVSASASRDKAGKVHVSLVNVHPTAAVTVACELAGVAAKGATGRVLTGDKLDAHNTFADPDAVEPKAFDGAKLAGGKLSVELPGPVGSWCWNWRSDFCRRRLFVAKRVFGDTIPKLFVPLDLE